MRKRVSFPAQSKDGSDHKRNLTAYENGGPVASPEKPSRLAAGGTCGSVGVQGRTLLQGDDVSSPRFSIVPAKWLQPESPLDSSARLVLCVLCQYASTSTRVAWPSVALIAACSHLSRRTIQRCIRDLERAGAVKVERRKVGTVNDSNLYTVMGFDPEGVAQPLRGGSAKNGRGVAQPLRPNGVKKGLTTGGGLSRTLQGAPDPAVDEAVANHYADRSKRSKRVAPPEKG